MSKEYTAGTKVFCDFHFGGKPKGVAVKVLKPGSGKSSDGLVLVRLTETIGAYRKGEEVQVASCYAVPRSQEFRKRGSFFRWVNTAFAWV